MFRRKINMVIDREIFKNNVITQPPSMFYLRQAWDYVWLIFNVNLFCCPQKLPPRSETFLCSMVRGYNYAALLGLIRILDSTRFSEVYIFLTSPAGFDKSSYDRGTLLCWAFTHVGGRGPSWGACRATARACGGPGRPDAPGGSCCGHAPITETFSPMSFEMLHCLSPDPSIRTQFSDVECVQMYRRLSLRDSRFPPLAEQSSNLNFYVSRSQEKSVLCLMYNIQNFKAFAEFYLSSAIFFLFLIPFFP